MNWKVPRRSEITPRTRTTLPPGDGLERTAYSVLATILAATGFAAILLALMGCFWLGRGRDITLTQGLAWGLAGYLAMFVAPAIGLPPEIPGVLAAPAEQRQLWWILAASSLSVTLGLVAFAPMNIDPLGIPVLAIPYLVGAPHTGGPLFSHPDPAALHALAELNRQFVIGSVVVNLVFWLLLGLACRLVFNRWLHRVAPVEGATRT